MAGGERETGTPDVTINDPDDVIGRVAGGGGSGERATGTPNTVYNLSSVLFHALQGGASYDTYIEDAEREGDEELTEFFRRVREEDRDRAAEARMLLAERTLTAAGTEGTAPRVATTEGLAAGVVTTEGSELDTSPGTERLGSSPGTEPGAESTSSGGERRTYAVTEMSDEDLAPPEDAVLPDASEPPGDTSRAEAGQSPRTEPVGPPSGEGDVQPGSTGEAATPRPEPSDDFPGTQPVEGEDPTARSEEVLPPPEEVPPPRAEEGQPGPPPPRTQGASLDTPLSQEEMIRRQAKRDRGEEDKGLTDDVRDAIFDEGGRGTEGTSREDRR